MEIKVLGPTEVRHDGSPVVLRGLKPRQLLVLLSLRANRPVRAEQLIEELWEGEPPPSAATALRVHFGRLRNVLEPERSPKTASVRLPAGPHGYLLRLEPDELDTERFERYVMMARDAVADSAPHTAIPYLTTALDLWRGPPLADVSDLTAAQAEIARLQDLRAVAFEELAEARLALGEHRLVVDILSGAVDDFPLREKLVAGLMTALYLGGRPLDALRVYSRLANRLSELGLVPSEPLHRLEEDILLQKPLAQPALQPAAAGHGYGRPVAVRMVGRHEQLRSLVEAVQTLVNERPRLCVITGPAGIGKSTLIGEFCSRVRADEFQVLAGTCQMEDSEPYEALAQILGTSVKGADHDSDADADSNAARDHVDIEAGGWPADSDRKSAQFRFYEQLVRDLAAKCSPKTLVVVEDLHFADRPTLRLLRHLIRHQTMSDVVFVASYRDDDIGHERLELIESLAPRSRTRTIRLGPFHEREVRSLIRSTAPPEDVELLTAQAAMLREVTGGNPFFLRELLRELDDESVKLTCQEDLASALSGLAPTEVRALIERRIARLTDSGRWLIYLASALADEISTDCLTALCQTSRENTLEALEECLAARLLVEDVHDLEQFVFPHDLVRNAVYASVPRSSRLELHRHIAEVLSAAPGTDIPSVVLARHYYEAAPLGLHVQAFEWASKAAVDAERNLLFAEAALWYERAIALQPELEQEALLWAQLHFALGRCLASDKEPERARTTFLAAANAARRTGDPRLLADIALAADGPWSSGSDFQPVALGLLEEALDRLDPADLARRVRILSGIASDLYYSDPSREEEAVRQAMEVSMKLDDAEARGIARLAFHRWLTHTPEALLDRLALTQAGLGEIQPNGATGELWLLTARSMLGDLLEAGQVDEFETLLAEYEDVATRLVSPRDVYWSMALRATEATLHGDLDAADQLARGAALRGQELEQLSAGALILQRFVIRYQQARLAEELPILRAASDSSVFRVGAALATTALMETGRGSHSLKLAREALGPDGSGLPRDVFWLAGMALFGGVAAQGGDQGLQEFLRESLAPHADHLIVVGVGGAILGSGHHWLGLLNAALGDVDSAVDSFTQAAAISRRINAPYWVAHAEIEVSHVLTSRGGRADQVESSRLARHALAEADRFGFGRILKRASDAR